MKFVIDQAIPFIQGVLEPYAEVVYKEGSEICPDDLKDADALVIRTRTRCDESLLGGSSVKMIATATIGTDHIDLDYCSSNGIFVTNAKGCNAGGVMNYVFSALYGTAARKSVNLSGLTLGVIGVGSVGGRVARMAQMLGFKVILNDPPRQEAEGPTQFSTLDYLLRNSDIVTIHAPLNSTTRGMADSGFFANMKKGAFFINASRGEIVDDKALINAAPKLGAIIIDTWNNEPDVNRELLDLCDIATPHIAGYSYQGKQTGTSMAVRSVARFFNLSELFDFYPPASEKELEAVKLDLSDKTQGQIAATFQYNYPVFTDDYMFRVHPEDFEKIRTDYKYRREFFID